MKPTLALVLALAAGCSFHPSKGGPDMSSGGGDLGDGAADLAPVGDDLMMICTPGAKSCAANTLSTCNLDGTAVDTSTCVLGCNSAGTDCQSLTPTAPAVGSDFVYGGLSDRTFSASQTLLVFDTDSGEIRDGAGAVVRMPNAAPMTRFVENGIGFHRTGGVGIWTFSKLTVPATATIVFKSPFAASILSASDLTINGTLDLRGYVDPTMALSSTATTLCASNVAGPGGVPGSVVGTPSTGAGVGGTPADTASGGGGGGYGDTGGAGGKHGGAAGGTIGAAAGDATLAGLAGGFGGGSAGGNGGGGGGALQLAAEGTLTVNGPINAGGCGGLAGVANLAGGGGGGSGGAILLEAPTVHVTATGILAANGGGGGAGGAAAATQGGAGRADDTQANGGSGGSGANGGSGGAGGTTTGQTGTAGNGAGGGGGGVGRVRINTTAGNGGTVDTGAIVSPAASSGTVVIQ